MAAGSGGDAGGSGAGQGGGGAGGTAGGGPIPLGLNDVSVLYPLPSSSLDEGYLRPKTAGARGELLPQEVFDAMPTFPVTPADGLVYSRMRVVALRFDGCGGLPEVCAPEIRAVMQPIDNDGSARDSALHLFYRG